MVTIDATGGRGLMYHYFYVTDLCRNRITNVNTAIFVLRIARLR